MAIFVVVVGENFFWLSKTIPSAMAVILRVEWFLKRHKRSFGRERERGQDPNPRTPRKLWK